MKKHAILAILLSLGACMPNAHIATPATTASPAARATASPSAPSVLASATPYEWCAGRLPDGFLIAGYLPDYRQPELKWGKCLTDILYFSAEPRADGSLDDSRLSSSTWAILQQMRDLYGTRLQLSIGGWERSGGFAEMTAKPGLRRDFMRNLMAFSQRYGLAGVDFDWEFPEGETQTRNYILLLSEAHAALAPQGMTVSVALSPDMQADPARFSIVDRIHIMSYDRGLMHATFLQAVDDLNVFRQAGVNKRKLVLGVPFYGRLMGSPYTAYPYSEIMARYQPTAQDDVADGIYFNGPDTIRHKGCLAREEQIGGVMIWELGQDTLDEGSLLEALHAAASRGCISRPELSE